MTQSITTEMLQSVIQTKLLNGQEVAIEEDLLMSGLVDSLGVMTLVSYIEETTGQTIPPQDVTLENFVSIAAIKTYLDGR